jgi:hypothetical protein
VYRIIDKISRCLLKISAYIVFTDLVQHKINTGTALPIRQHIRRLPFGKREIGSKEVNKMLTMGVIEPSSSFRSSPVVPVKKKDESTRFCVDYRKLNDVTVKDAYPLHLISDYLDALTGSICFSSMDLNSGFWQVSIDFLDKENDSLFNQYWSLLIYCGTFQPLWFVKYILKTFTEYTQRTTLGGVYIIYG